MSTKEFGCFFCKGKSTDPDGQCPECGRPINLSPELSVIQLSGYRAIGVLGRGFYGWTLHVEDDMQGFALKLIPRHRINISKEKFREPKTLVACSNPQHPNIARFIKLFEDQVEISGQRVSVLCLVFDYVPNSRPLRKVIEYR